MIEFVEWIFDYSQYTLTAFSLGNELRVASLDCVIVFAFEDDGVTVVVSGLCRQWIISSLVVALTMAIRLISEYMLVTKVSKLVTVFK